MTRLTHYIMEDDSIDPFYRIHMVYGAMTFIHLSIEIRRNIIHTYMSMGKRVIACKYGPYDDLEQICSMLREGRIP